MDYLLVLPADIADFELDGKTAKIFVSDLVKDPYIVPATQFVKAGLNVDPKVIGDETRKKAIEAGKELFRQLNEGE
jgi:hypothetical protein